MEISQKRLILWHPPLFLPTPLYSTVPPPKPPNIGFSQKYHFSHYFSCIKELFYIKIIKNKYKQ